MNRELLLSRLEKLEPGLSPREMVEQSTCYIFNNGQIFTFNEEVACFTESPLPVTMAIPAKSLRELLSKLPEEDLDMELADGKLQVKGMGRRVSLVVEAEISSPVDKVEVPQEWVKLPDQFLDALAVVQEVAASGRDAEFVLTCVHIAPGHIEACNNYQACRYTLQVPIEGSCLVKQAAVKHIPALGMTEMSVGPSWVHFRNDTGLRVSVRRWAEKYPNIGEIFTGGGDPITLPGSLAEAVDRAQIFSQENAGADDIYVKLKDGKMLIRGEGSYGKFEEQKQCEYKGTAAFRVAPKLLVEVTKRSSHCNITSAKLHIDSGSFVYVTSLEAV